MQTVTLPAHIRKIGSQRVARCSGLERFGAANATARQALTHAIGRQLRNSFTRKYLWAADGTAFVLYYSDGWQYDIIGQQHAARGYPPICSAGPVDGSYDEALEAMRRHVDTYAQPVSEYTPGPWTCVYRGRSYRISGDHNTICQSFHSDRLTPQDLQEQKANAQLIAAAPLMLAALEHCVPWMGRLIADGGHDRSVLPNDAMTALLHVEDAIADARKDGAA